MSNLTGSTGILPKPDMGRSLLDINSNWDICDNRKGVFISISLFKGIPRLSAMCLKPQDFCVFFVCLHVLVVIIVAWHAFCYLPCAHPYFTSQLQSHHCKYSHFCFFILFGMRNKNPNHISSFIYLLKYILCIVWIQ